MDIQTRINKINRDYVEHLKKIGGGRVSNNLGRPIGGAKQKKGGYSWEQFLDDTDEAVTTAGRIGHSFLGLGKKGTKRGGKVEPNLTKGEPVQNLTIQHIRDRKQNLYSPDGVMFSQYTAPEDMRDQSVRPDMPLDQTEVIKPKPPMTQWQAFKKGISIIPHLIGALAGGEKPKPKRKYVKKNLKGEGAFSDFFHGISPLKRKQLDADKKHAQQMIEWKKQTDDYNAYKKAKEDAAAATAAMAAEKAADTPAPAPEETPTPTPTTGAGKKSSKWIEHVKAYAKKHNMKYNEALKDSKCKSQYHNSK